MFSLQISISIVPHWYYMRIAKPFLKQESEENIQIKTIFWEDSYQFAPI